MPILHYKLYILILFGSLCSETFELFKMSMFIISSNIFFRGVGIIWIFLQKIRFFSSRMPILLI